MFRVAISAGHNPKAKGALNAQGTYEFDLTVPWADRLAALLSIREDVKVVRVPTGSLSSKIGFINQQWFNLALEVHFNSCAAAKVRGSETLYCPGSVVGERAARVVQRTMAAIMPPNRGTKEGWYRMDRPGIADYAGDVDGDEVIDAFLRNTRCPAIIVEPEFIQNEQVIRDSEALCCEVIAMAVYDVLLGGR